MKKKITLLLLTLFSKSSYCAQAQDHAQLADGMTPFLAAIENGDVAKATQLMKEGVNPAETDSHGNTAFHIAAQSKKVTVPIFGKIIFLLKDQKNLINEPNDDGFGALALTDTPMKIALLKGIGARDDLKIQKLSQEQRDTVLAIIRDLAPALYEKIVAVDPTGKNHILYDKERFIVGAHHSISDGLPLFSINPVRFFDPRITYGIQKFLIGHELSHYKNRDCLIPKASTHKELFATSADTNPFTLASSRINEFKADRDSILCFGNAIDDGIAFVEYTDSFIDPTQTYKTFKQEHPLSQDRKAHLKSLNRDLEVLSSKTKDIDWDTIIASYKLSDPIPIALQEVVNLITDTTADEATIYEKLETLLMLGLSPDQEMQSGKSLVDVAKENDRQKVVKLLIDYNAHIK